METAHCSEQQLPSGADDIRLDSCLRYSIAPGKKVVEAADLGADKRSRVFDKEFLFGMLSNYLRWALHIHSFAPKLPFRLCPSSCFSAYVSSSSSSIAFSQFSQSPANVHEFLSLLQQFSERLIWVKAIHSQIITSSIFKNQILATKLVKAYSDLGILVDARHVFDQFRHPITILCNAMIYGYLRKERYNETLNLFSLMGFCNLETDSYMCNLHSRRAWAYQIIKGIWKLLRELWIKELKVIGSWGFQ
ncbi:unnamed protein product [Prunus armeniaca]|uniref:Pentatricopeptide repeat-containing protein n=1 Tax=Prunus armeniaca TaxID=36596 RepID=A0A6J5VH06_PRUAR|nr:unnamed protein product [Prunus armeniaca]